MDGNPFTGLPAGELSDTILQLHAAECAIRRTLVRVIAAFDARESWREDGATSMTSWLAAQLGVAHATAAHIVAAGKKLEGLPAIAAAFEDGLLSWDKVRSLTRIAIPDTDRDLAEQARGLSAAQTHNLARRVRAVKESENTRHERSLRMWWDHDRQWLRLHGRLPGDEGAAVEKAMARLADQAGPDPSTGMFESWDVRCADALVELAGARLAADPDPDLATVVVHVDAGTLTGRTGFGEIEHGPLTTADTARRLACDGRLQIVLDGPDGLPVGIGRTGRKIPAWLNRQIRRRDNGCRFPGCERTRWAHAHHLVHWADGGPTDLDNLASLCSYHHRLVHEGGWRIAGDPNHGLLFIRPDGRPYQPRPQPLRPEVRERLIEPATQPAYADSS